MTDCYTHTKKFSRSRLSACVLAVIGVILGHGMLRAQGEYVGNRFVGAHIITDRASNIGGGRFYMEAGPSYDLATFLFSPAAPTSCVVFKIETGTDVYFYTNAKPSNGEQPRNDATGEPVPYLPFDSVYVASPDTIEVIWKKVHGFTITQRLFTERPRTIYDDGGDIIIEFSYACDPFIGSRLGIFLMLDTYNSDANSSGGANDFSSILTSSGFFPADRPGKRFQPPADSIPDWYHIGDFSYQPEPRLNTYLPIHRLKGFSHGGLQLTPPEMFAVGSWRNFRFRSWSIQGSDIASSLGDCATAMRWADLTRTGTVRTAFGLSDRNGNNIYHCRDNDVFIDIKTERLIEQKEKDGVFTPSQFDVTMWVTNTTEDAKTYTVTLNEPIGFPNYRNRLARDASTPGSQTVMVLQRQTAILRWKINVEPGTNDSLIQIPLDFRYLVGTSGAQPRLLRDKCQPLIAIKGWRQLVQPPPDTLPPPILRLLKQRNPLPNWTFRTFDRHRDFEYDTGLDRIVVEENNGGNFNFSYALNPFVRCDTTINVDLLASLIDTTRKGRIVFAVYDCWGNVSRDSATYDPRPDIFKPVISKMVVGRFEGLECNSRTYEYHFIDSLNQTPAAGDAGFGSIEILPPLANFYPIEINPHSNYAPMQPFDWRASFKLTVIDSMFNGYAAVRVADYAGNADTIKIFYCTLPDTLAPIAVVTPVTPSVSGDPIRQWGITADDIRAWDRGLESVVALSSTNMLFTPPTISPGQDDVTFSVEVVDDEFDGEIILEVRDLIYTGIPAGHADTVRITYDKIPDTLAPNIIFTPVPGTGGAIADVEVNDIHYFGTEWYKYDRGLAVVAVLDISSNMRLVTPITFSQGDSVMYFRVEVINPLALHSMDSICIEAIDLYNNRSTGCYYYPLQPDIRSPLFSGIMSQDRSRIAGNVSDVRTYDRGLGSIMLENPVNVTLNNAPVTGLAGKPTHGIELTVSDPTAPISGTLVLRDLVADLDPSLETQVGHTVYLPFALPVVRLKLELPLDVEPGEEFTAPVIATTPFTADAVQTVAFNALYRGEADYVTWRDGLADMAVTSMSGQLGITLRTLTGHTYGPGDTLGTLVFKARGTGMIETFNLLVDHSSLVANNNAVSRVTAAVQGDAEFSVMELRAPYTAILADSTTYVNGECYRILNSKPGSHSKATGFAVLGVKPQPATPAGGTVDLDIREMPAGGVRGELVAANGQTVTEFQLESPGAQLMRVSVALPSGLSSGAYFLRLRTATDYAWVKIMIVE